MPIYYGLDLTGWILIVIASIITIVADCYVNKSYGKYKRIMTKNELTWVEVARKILDANGLEDVHVVETKGVLSDHYDPGRKVVRLSKEIFHGTTIAAASVAAHEVGHAIQDQDNYIMIRIRGMLVPFVNFGSKFGYIVLFIGLIFGYINLAWGGIALLLLILVFQLVTLPVEFDASNRALVQLEKQDILLKDEIQGSKKMLKAAAYTYVAGLANTILQILRLVLIVLDQDDR